MKRKSKNVMSVMKKDKRELKRKIRQKNMKEMYIIISQLLFIYSIALFFACIYTIFEVSNALYSF